MVTHICKLSAGERETFPSQPRLISKPQFPERDLSKYIHTHTHDGQLLRNTQHSVATHTIPLRIDIGAPANTHAHIHAYTHAK